MSERPPFGALVLAMIGAGMLVYVRHVSGTKAEILTVGGFICLIFVIAWAIKWTAEKGPEILEQFLNALDPQMRKGKLIREMTPEQAKRWDKMTGLAVDVSVEGEKWVYGTDAPLAFMKEFLDLRPNEYYLCPITTWNSDTVKQDWAKQITNVLFMAQYIEKARGPFPARWREGITAQMVAYQMEIKLKLPSPIADGLTPFVRNDA